MKKLRLIRRLAVFFVLFAFTVIFFKSLLIFVTRDKIRRQKKVSKLLQNCAKKQIKSLGITITAAGREHLKEGENYLIVANHVGYMDIVILQSLIHNNRFITHDGARGEDRVLNLIAKTANAYSIQRNLKNIRSELRAVTDILKNGFHLIFFPEGTSTDGSKILPFYPFFFTAGLKAGKPVLPICIQYTKIGEENFNTRNRDFICWYGEEPGFKEHLIRLLKIKSLSVHIRFLPPLDPKGKSAKALAEESRQRIQKYYTPPQAP